MHLLGVAVLDPSTAPERFSFPRARELFEARLHLVPPFRRRAVEVPFGLHNPIWIEDPDFDLDYHLRRAALPAPGGPKELAAFVADVASRQLDRRRPLWEAFIVEGLEHGYCALVAKLHHSIVDGIAGVDVIAALFDLAADAPLDPDQPPDEWQPDAVPTDVEMLGFAAAGMVKVPRLAVRAVGRFGSGIVRAIRAPKDDVHITLPLTAPRLSMNRLITP